MWMHWRVEYASQTIENGSPARAAEWIGKVIVYLPIVSVRMEHWPELLTHQSIHLWKARQHSLTSKAGYLSLSISFQLWVSCMRFTKIIQNLFAIKENFVDTANVYYILVSPKRVMTIKFHRDHIISFLFQMLKTRFF